MNIGRVRVSEPAGRLSDCPARFALCVVVSSAAFLASACGAPDAQPGAAGQTQAGGPRILAIETYLADIAQNVAGDRARVDALIPVGMDPHGFQPTPADVRKVAESDLLIANGAGFEEFLGELLENAGGDRPVVEASAGLASRQPKPGEPEGEHAEVDPHFWLDPVLVEKYVENIRDALSQVDPAGKDAYAANAAAYIARLQELDGWIKEQVRQTPPERRLLVTNHESFGYFADRYGFRIVGAIVPSVSTGASPSAGQLAELVDHIRQTGASAVFLETGANAGLAQQLAQETGIQVVTGLYTHSITEPGGAAPDFIAMMKYNTQAIVDALK
jgi:ABC-type Zn uptake system ZnuABC Zn-binding protein ZnuA